MNLIFVGPEQDVVSAWEEHFQGYAQVSVQAGSIFEVDCDALVSPANSFGYMDGGLDMLISEFFGWHVQERLQDLIRNKHHGELLVGVAEISIVSTPYALSSPTNTLSATPGTPLGSQLSAVFQSLPTPPSSKSTAREGAHIAIHAEKTISIVICWVTDDAVNMAEVPPIEVM